MITNEQINVLRIQAFQKYGHTRMIRLRTIDGLIRFYLCTMKGDRILSVLAGGGNYQELVAQL